MHNSFVKLPNLPESADTIIIGKQYESTLFASLKSKKINTITIPADSRLDKRIASHSDLSLLHLGGNNLITANREVYNLLSSKAFNISFFNLDIGDIYPADCYLNICIVGKLAFLNEKITPNIIKKLLYEYGFEVVNTKQGYARCSTCIVNEYSIITADASIHNAAQFNNIDSLLIEPGYIDLKGYDYGFIGGSSFKISENELAFTGVLDSHPNKDAIESFLKDKKIEPIFLSDSNMFDIGSAIPIIEKTSADF